MKVWNDLEATVDFKCAKCRKQCLACVWEFEGFMDEYHRHIENDTARVEAVCAVCYQKHFARYERHKP